MEYVEGERYATASPPHFDGRIFFHRTQCCEGLQAAHEKASSTATSSRKHHAHRGNRVKILDFGVARRAWNSNPDDATRAWRHDRLRRHSRLHGPRSPPAASRRRTLRHFFSRSRLLRNAGGEQPFKTTASPHIAASSTPNRPRSQMSRPIAAIISRALAKDPNLRYPRRRSLGRSSPRRTRWKAKTRSVHARTIPSQSRPRRSRDRSRRPGRTLAYRPCAACSTLLSRIMLLRNPGRRIARNQNLAVLPFTAAPTPTKTQRPR